jgi:diacylglycerol kinase (ATP)
MRCAAVLGLGCSEKDLRPFQRRAQVEWRIGLPESSAAADAVAVFGGDGTIHRHLGALVRLGLPVLVVPHGSGNDFARALGLHRVRDSLSAWDEFASGGQNVKTIDLGVIEPLVESAARATGTGETTGRKYFCSVGGVGLDAEVARRANCLPRWLRGHGGYALSLPGALFDFAPLRMRLSVASGRGYDLIHHSEKLTILAAFANTPHYGGGMKIAPRACPDDGLLDVCLVTDDDWYKLFCLFPKVYSGGHVAARNVEYWQTPRLRLETETPLDVYADGELVCRTPIEVGVTPLALRVIVGQADKSVRPTPSGASTIKG